MTYDYQVENEIVEEMRNVLKQIMNNKDSFFSEIKSNIETAIIKINCFNKLYVLGGLGARSLGSAVTILDDLEEPTDINKDNLETIRADNEIALEYAMSIATATPNSSENIPTQNDIDDIFNLVNDIRYNLNIYELVSELPENEINFDHWLKINTMLSTMNMRGDGYHIHINELSTEIFSLHDVFLEQYYKFKARDLLDVINDLSILVISKIGCPSGGFSLWSRFRKWTESKNQEEIIRETERTGKHFIELFAKDNPDLPFDEKEKKFKLFPSDAIQSYPKLFRVDPKNEMEKIIFDQLSIQFGYNHSFFQPPKFKAFPLGDSLIPTQPIIVHENIYYYFSPNLPSRNLFKIFEKLIKSADPVYHQHKFRGNTYNDSKDNYLEKKTKELFQKILPNATFYHSLKYKIVEDGQEKNTELDLLGITDDRVFIIEVKAGELNPKHRRGAIKGLKDRLNETVSEGSYQCHRALRYIHENEHPKFTYIANNRSEELTISKSTMKNYYKISVWAEHLWGVSTNLNHLIKCGILNPDYNWSWLVSILDLMVFADLIENEEDFTEYLDHRFSLYDKDNIECHCTGQKIIFQ